MLTSWVISTSVAPSDPSSCSTLRTPAPDFESRLPVGSSARMIAGTLRDRPRDRDALALAAGELRWPEVEPVTEADALQRGAGERAALPERHAGVEHPGGDVVDRGHRLLEVEGLEDKADLVGSQSRELTVRGLDGVVARDPHEAGGGPLQGSEDREHRRLAGTRGADHGDLVPGWDHHADIAQRRDSAGILLRHLGELDAHPCESVTCRPG